MILCAVSSRISLTADESKRFTAASMLSAAPAAKAPVWRSLERTAGGVLKSILAMSYGSPAPPPAALAGTTGAEALTAGAPDGLWPQACKSAASAKPPTAAAPRARRQ